MPAESISISLLSIISLLSFFVTLMISKFSNKIGNGVLLDEDFTKPQAFHKESVPRSGGLAAIISLIIFFILYYFLFEKILLEYFILSISMFFIGFFEDAKFKINPIYRLVLMITILSFIIIFFSIKITSIDLNFLNSWIKNSIFSIFFVLLCFLFIINGSNLVDGFNGLLVIHLLLINSVLLYLNLDNNHEYLTIVITAQIVVLISFLLFNFPTAKMFLGDSGSYLFGCLIAYNIIQTNNLNPQISSFFFCILLFYLFFEVFFSFFRKLYLKKSPFRPDQYHLHMLSYNFLNKSAKFKDCNYLNSFIINLIYLCLILPAFFFNDNGFLCKYWFFSLLVIYMVFYYFLLNFQKKNISQ